jgi:RES domain-containing protein
MILTNLGPDALFYRAFTPQWAHAPESGAGAAVRGGRFNRPGVEARYLASTAEAALIEYRGESALLPPATIASFLVAANNVVDFTGGFHADAWREIWAEAYCNWKMLAFVEDVEPPSWVIGDLVREAEFPGILYCSARDPNMTCLVLFPELAAKSGFSAPVHDPDKRLPRDASSWRSG